MLPSGILLLLLRDDLLQSGGLSDLICVLLGAELHKGCLVDPLQSGHVGMLRRIVEYVSASSCRMSDSRASEFARIVPSVCKLLSTMPSPKSLVAAWVATIRWLSWPSCSYSGYCGRDIDRGCLVAENHPDPGIGRIHPPLHVAVCVSRRDISPNRPRCGVALIKGIWKIRHLPGKVVGGYDRRPRLFSRRVHLLRLPDLFDRMGALSRVEHDAVAKLGMSRSG